MLVLIVQQRYYRIYRRSCRRKGKAGRMHKWIRLCMPIPARFHDVVESFLFRDLAIHIKPEGNLLVISATLASGEPS